MAVPIVVHPAAAYATKVNIAYPGTSAQATADETTAQTVINDRLTEVTVTVAAGAIEVAS